MEKNGASLGDFVQKLGGELRMRPQLVAANMRTLPECRLLDDFGIGFVGSQAMELVMSRRAMFWRDGEPTPIRIKHACYPENVVWGRLLYSIETSKCSQLEIEAARSPGAAATSS